ncbi:unnamed protein product [Parnassius apollo]|uniref:(apollo) hypothetical protein n=1 Tax=Parnassius apollo TaxID=110799 RepID=A0A8S3XZX2_PARAO|nr:unnamed protein product [Parnassius apollo]
MKTLRKLRYVKYFSHDLVTTIDSVTRRLGYKKSNCKAVRNIIDTYYKTQYAEPIADGRDHNPNPSQIDSTKVKEHIMSFRSVVSHYRRVHAPNRKYLPSDINIRMMYDNHCEKEPEINVPYGFYRNVVNELKISFTKLGHEECELCETFSIHNPNAAIRHRYCEECQEYEDHHTRYISARKKYEEDVESQTKQKSTDTIIFAVDLEKVTKGNMELAKHWESYGTKLLQGEKKKT